MESLVIEPFCVLAATGIAAKVLNALSVLLGLGLVIFFHELGHFAVAKWCDVHVERFSIGIGPILWSRQKGETEYALSALPLGGYVKMLGQDDMDPNQMTSDEIAENPRSYSAKKVWQRMAIISAGVIMNIATGFLFFAIAFRMGVMQASPTVGLVHPGSPAWVAGIQRDDVITAINGETIRSFADIQQAIILSRGDVTVEGVHKNGEEFSLTITPVKGKTTRFVGVSPALSLNLADGLEPDVNFTMPGLPARNASAQFKPGDRVLSLNGQSVKSFDELHDLSARFAAEDLIYQVERKSSVDGDTDSEATSVVDITIPPGQFKSVGLWMAIGPVKAIVDGSIAAQAGMQVGDQIRTVDGKAVGTEIDPLRLPNLFAEKAGQAVTVTVVRQTPNSGDEEVTLNITPSDKPGWSEPPVDKSSPLPIPAIGAAIHVLPRIAKVVEGSEAALSDAFQVGQRISKITLEYADPANIEIDGLQDTKPAMEIDLETPDEDDESPGESNWAYAFHLIQKVPLRNVRIHVAKGEDGTGGAAHLLTELEHVEGWYLPIRGINGWESQSFEARAEGWGEAFGMGFRHTENSGISIYLTLRSLVTGELSARALSGPVGIAKIGYQVADRGVTSLLLFLGFLSINLAVLNFLPIPVLDGGHMVFLIWEGISRRKPSPRVIGWAHAIGLAFIISLFVFVLYLDIFVNP